MGKTMHTYVLDVTAPNGDRLSIRRMAVNEQVARVQATRSGYTVHSAKKAV